MTQTHCTSRRYVPIVPAVAQRGDGKVQELSNVAEVDPLGPLLAAAGGDRRAFQRLYQISSPRLFAIAVRILRRRDLAEEALQDAFVAIWQRAGQYQAARGAPMAWMGTVVRNRAIDLLRRGGQEVTGLEPDRHARAEPALSDLAENVRNCLATLQESQRRAILLAYYYGMTHQELADRLDAPLGTVKSWVRRGLLQIKDCLQP